MINKKVLKWSLEELSNIEQQRRLWLGQSKDEMSSFEEACCGVFDDSGLTRAFDKGLVERDYGEGVASMVKELGVLVGSVESNLSPKDVIQHRAMTRMRSLSKELLETDLCL